MKNEHPILVSTPMVKAILEGRKTQTRRVVKPQPPNDAHGFLFLEKVEWTTKRKIDNTWIYFVQPETGSWPCNDSDKLKCPYGKVGDILWVRETFQILPPNMVFYKADTENKATGNWKPSIFMPRKACRIELEITSIRVERLMDITENDAIKEGVVPDKYTDHPKGVYYTAYSDLWEKINGKGAWDKNPWVWVIEFKIK